MDVKTDKPVYERNIIVALKSVCNDENLELKVISKRNSKRRTSEFFAADNYEKNEKLLGIFGNNEDFESYILKITRESGEEFGYTGKNRYKANLFRLSDDEKVFESESLESWWTYSFDDTQRGLNVKSHTSFDKEDHIASRLWDVIESKKYDAVGESYKIFLKKQGLFD